MLITEAEVHAETDAGPRRAAAGTERLCLVTRAVRPVADMIRFVAGPDQTVTPDIRRKLPGRGVWVSASREILAEAVKRNVFARGLKQPVRVPPDLVDITERLCERAALDALSIAHKAGLVKIGFARVEAALAGDAMAALIQAADAAPDGARKLAGRAAQRSGRDGGSLPLVTAFTSAQLDLALGRSNVIHAALLTGPASGTFLARCRGLQRFRGADPGAGERYGPPLGRTDFSNSAPTA